jgi:ribosomal protein S18 acetylase RimI-like enzyme
VLPLSWWEARIVHPNGNSAGFGAFRAGDLVGAVALEFESKERTAHKASLIGMYVRADTRKSGAGRALVECVLAHARSRGGVEVVQLTMTEGNAAAHRLYRSLGFVDFGVEPLAVRYPDGYRSKIHMWCDLRR